MAVIVAVLCALTELVVMVKFGEAVAPPATVMDAGTEAADGFELLRLTASPPAGAGVLSVTLPLVIGFPPGMVRGLAVKLERTIGITERLTDLVTPPKAAEMVTTLCTLTEFEVVIVKFADVVLPSGTITE